MKTKPSMKIKNSNQLEVCFEAEDKLTHKMNIFKFRHTEHSITRASQRGINSSTIALVLEFGKTFFMQGLNYYVLGERDIPDFLSKEKSHIKNTVVITAGDTNQVITCYKANNPFKRIKHKSKELYKNYKVAA